MTLLLRPGFRIERDGPGYPGALAVLGHGEPEALTGCGPPALLGHSLVALFCSVAVPGEAMLAAYDLARAMREALNRLDLVPIHQPARTGDVKHSQADLSHIRQKLGYEPIVEFAPGLRATLEWYRKTLSRL